MRRLVPALVILALAAVACGGSGKSSTAASAPSGQSAETLLAGVKPATGPQKVTADVTVTLDGTPSSLGSAAPFLQQPINLKVSGVTDPATSASNVDLTISLGALNVAAKLLTDGKHAWLQYQDQWYDIGPLSNAGAIASSATGGAAPTVDPARLRQLASEPGKLMKDPKVVGTGDAAGVPSTHVAGTLDLTPLMDLAQAGAGATTSGGTTAAPVQSAITQAQQALKAADVSVWIGQSDNQVHRATAHIIADTSQVASAQGMKGLTLDVDATTTGTGPVSVTPPANPKSISELQQAVLGALLPALAGSLPTTTG